MSMESAKAFIERIKTDEEFGNKVAACKDADTRLAFIQGEGFACSAEEVKQLSSELTDEELGHISGGVNHHTCQANLQGQFNL